jgi:hypothetical protein
MTAKNTLPVGLDPRVGRRTQHQTNNQGDKMTSAPKTSAESSTSGIPPAVREPLGFMPPNTPILVDEWLTQMGNLPVSVNIERYKGPRVLDRSPFTRQQWYKILNVPPITTRDIPDADPFFFDLKYFQTHPKVKVFHRPAHESELRNSFWREIGMGRNVCAVIAYGPVGTFKTYLISLPLGQLSQAIHGLRIHAATINTISRACVPD